MGAGQGHGRDRLSSLREKMYGYRMPLPDSATPRAIRLLPTQRGGSGFFLLPFSFPGVRCASSSIPGVEQWGIDKFGTGSLVWRDKKRMVV